MIAALTATVKKLRWLSWHRHRIIPGQHGGAIGKISAPNTINYVNVVE
jgi:hypothetical protein